MLETIVALAIRSRKVVAGFLVLVLALGVIAARRLPIDALPDVSSVQVDILTKCGGLSLPAPFGRRTRCRPSASWPPSSS